MIAETNRKRRKLERERRALERPQPSEHILFRYYLYSSNGIYRSPPHTSTPNRITAATSTFATKNVEILSLRAQTHKTPSASTVPHLPTQKPRLPRNFYVISHGYQPRPRIPVPKSANPFFVLRYAVWRTAAAALGSRLAVCSSEWAGRWVAWAA